MYGVNFWGIIVIPMITSYVAQYFTQTIFEYYIWTLKLLLTIACYYRIEIVK